MSQTELSIRMRTRLYTIGAITTALLALTGMLTGHFEGASIALLFSILLVLNIFFIRNNLLTHITTLFLAASTLLSITSNQYSVAPWSYIFPLLLFFFYPLKIASTLVALYSLCLIIIFSYLSSGPIKVEFLINYLLCLALTGGFVYLREVKNKQLKPLRRTDNLTLASTKEHLNDDFEKEIQRSEREGTELSVMALAIDERGFDQVDTADHDTLLHKLGQALHENLRAFDSYYRWKDHEFFIILPYTTTKESMKTAENLRLRIKETLSNDQQSITVSVGTASLNAGDTASSMLDMSLKALHQARESGSNRTQSYVDASSL